MSAPQPAELKLTWRPVGVAGVVAITFEFSPGDTVTERLNICDSARRENLIKRLCADRPGLDQQALADRLEGIAAERVGAQGGSSPRTSQTDRLVQLATSTPGSEGQRPVQLFHTRDGDAYADVPAGSHRETWDVYAKGFRDWLSNRYYRETGKAPGAQSLQDAINTLAGRARYDGPELAVSLRIAEHDGDVWLDLGDAQRNAVRITAEGWTVIPSGEVPVRFLRRKGMQPLPAPAGGGSIEELRPLLNMEDDDLWTLLVGWLIGAFNPRGPYGVLTVNGEKGSGKSTACKLARRLIDPNKADLRRPPRDERDVFITASNGWVCTCNNVSALRPELADAICALATDGGFATRALYQNEEETIFDARRPVILNGIDELTERSDLVDRMIMLFLPPIPAQRRMEEREVLARFAAVHARLLGALLNAVSAALRNLPSLEIGALPRMADLTKWVTAAEPGLGEGWWQGRFLEAYTRNTSDAVVLTVESSPIGPPIQALMNAGPWRGTHADLLTKLNTIRGDAPPPEGWPKNPRGLGSALRRLAPSLRAMGYHVLIPARGSGHRKERIIQLEQVGMERSARSAQPANPLPDAGSGDQPPAADRPLDDVTKPPHQPSADSDPAEGLPVAAGPDADHADRADCHSLSCSHSSSCAAGPRTPCHACGCANWWQPPGTATGWTCARCHPPAPPDAAAWAQGGAP